MYLVERSDTTRNPRAAFMTVFAQYSEAITEGGYYKGSGY